MQVLLIYEVIPDYMELYLIEDPTEEQLEVLHKAHGAYVNLDNDADVTTVPYVVDAVCEDPDQYNKDLPEHWHGIWANCKFPSDQGIGGKYDLIFCTGILNK